MTTIYQAGPLFTEAEKSYHRYLTLLLEKAKYAVIWPGDLLSDEEIAVAGKGAGGHIFGSCRKALDESDVVVALLDGPQVDDGTAWEIGYAYAKGKPVFGIRTDSRNAGETEYGKVNSMIEQCLSGMATNTEDLVRLVKEWSYSGA